MSASARRIDVHLHVIPPFYKEAAYNAGTGPAIGRYPDWTPELALSTMDTNGIDVALLSVAQPGVQFAPREQGRRLARRCNEYGADLMARHKRFGGFCLVPMHEIDDGVGEITHCLDNLKFQGVCLFASYGEKYLGDSVFDPVLHALNERDAVVFIHPTYHPSSKKLDLAWPGFLMEYLFDTTRAAVNIVLTGTLDRFPRIKFILAHAGGTVPYFAWRISVSPMIDPRMPQMTSEKILAGLRHFWYDNALSWSATTMGSLLTVASPDRILFGSDWPFANARVVAEGLKAHTASTLHSSAQLAAIDRGNAIKLFPELDERNI